MKYTLLEMTQDILSNMSSDQVNSISDTVESLQVATIIKQKYYDIINRLDLPNHEELIQLTPSINPSIPVVMYIPDGIDEIKWLKYYDSNVLDGNTSDDFAHDLNTDLTTTINAGVAPPGYLRIDILPNEDFINMITSFTTADTNVFTYTLTDNANSFTFNAKNDRQPCYCTILSNYYILFDSYDSSQDTTLQANKTMAFAETIPVFRMSDTFIPDLSEEQFPLLLNESKALAYFELKQQPHPLAAQEANRGWSTIQKKKAIINRPTYFNELPNYGRRAGYYGFRGGYYTSNNRGQY